MRPDTAHQRCWVHVIARVLAALPKWLHPRAKQLLHGICYAESRTQALAAAKVFADELAGHPKAVAKVMDNLDVLLTFYDFPAEHWKHLRSTNLMSVNRPDEPVAGGGCAGTERGGWTLAGAGGGRADDDTWGSWLGGHLAA